MNKTNNENNGIGFLGALAILFIALKLTNIISWDWIWVLAPLWGGIALVAALVLIIWIPFLIISFFSYSIEIYEKVKNKILFSMIDRKNKSLIKKKKKNIHIKKK